MECLFPMCTFGEEAINSQFPHLGLVVVVFPLSGLYTKEKLTDSLTTQEQGSGQSVNRPL